MFRRMRTPKGALFVVIGLIVFVLWLIPLTVSVVVAPRSDPHVVRLFAPLVMLLMCMVTLLGGGGDRSISFTPGEVNFLFPGPFTRRQLLLYKLSRTLNGGVISGLFLSLILNQHATYWVTAIAAAMLTMIFVQLVTLAATMLSQSAAARAYSMSRKIVLGAILALIAMALSPTLLQLARDGAHARSAMDIAIAVRHAPAMQVLLAPFEPFVRTFTAQSAVGFALWGSAAVLIDAGLFWLIIWLDADYREAALAASQRMADRMARLRKGQFSLQQSRAKPSSRFGRVPMLPWLGGAGPTIWRQLTVALRSLKSVMFVLALMTAGFVPMLFNRQAGMASVTVTAIWGTLLLTMILKFDFRADLEQLEWQKAMPLSPLAIAIGQLAVPVLMVTLAQSMLVVAVFTVLDNPDQRSIALAILPFLLPFNLLTISVENLMFLLAPMRPLGAAPGDIGLMGRQMVFFIAKMLIVTVAAALAAGTGMGTYFTTHSFIAAGAAALGVLLLIGATLVACVGWAYAKFDPSADTPA
jgi:hypothetical protein